MFFLAGSVFAENLGVSEGVETFVKEVVGEKGIDKEKIQNVEKVDFENLPEEVKIGNIDETNLAMYEVDYGEEKPVFVITVSDIAFKKTLKEIVNKMLLNFGYDGEIINSTFLKTATGVQTSEDKGYVMVRRGSITGISTNLEVFEAEEFGEAEILIYKNSEPVGFRNHFLINETGVKNDYEIISADTLVFEPGDIISVYTNVKGKVKIGDIITIIEINVLE